MTEADTCRKFVVPLLQKAGWDDDPHSIAEQRCFTAGLDAPTCRNVVLVRLVNSMVEFKQIIGRDTRVREEYGKLTFNILDYTGTATRNFADPAFATQEEIDEYGRTTNVEVETTEENEDNEGEVREGEGRSGVTMVERGPEPRRKYYFDGGQVEIAAELVHELDPDGKQLQSLLYAS